jgi:hypothetical protein
LVDTILASSACQLKTGSPDAYILSNCQVKNRHKDVTGVLAHADRNFAQVLEGRPEAVGDILQSILRDARHGDIRVLRDISVPQRRFGDWSMGYVEGFGASQLIEHLLTRAAPSEADIDALLERLLLPPRL